MLIITTFIVDYFKFNDFNQDIGKHNNSQTRSSSSTVYRFSKTYKYNGLQSK